MDQKIPRVLLIEPESDLRALESLILEESGYRVDPLPPDAEPVEYAARTHPDVIVVHVRPGPAPRAPRTEPRDWAVIDSLEADPRTEAIPVVVVSASERVAAEAKAVPIVRQVVVMPYDIDALRNAVANALGNPPPAAVLPPPRGAPAPSLAVAARLVNQHSREIVLRAIRRLQQIQPFASRFAQLSPALVGNLPVILGAIVVALQRNLRPEQVAQAEAIQTAIREHVALRISQGLSPGSVIEEYQVLNDQTLEVLRQHIGEASFSAMDAFDVARTIDLFFAQILRVTVNFFLEQVKCPPQSR